MRYGVLHCLAWDGRRHATGVLFVALPTSPKTGLRNFKHGVTYSIYETEPDFVPIVASGFAQQGGAPSTGRPARQAVGKPSTK